jgi:hypothetical protein
MSDTIERVSEACHEALRQISISMGQEAPPVWGDAAEWMRETTRNGVTDLLASPGMGPEEIHNAWMARKLSEGWVFGPTKSSEHKTHPCLVHYCQLPLGERYKDILFRMTATIHLDLHGVKLDDPYTARTTPKAKA